MNRRQHNDSPEVRVVIVNADIAREWLGRNRSNRKIRDIVARAYATDMVNGDWRWTGETIKFAADGTLIDGQHRAYAVVLADENQPGIEVPMLVVDGLAPEAQEDIDRGVPRKFHDVLAMRGELNTAALAAVVRYVALWESGSRAFSKGGHTVAQLLRVLDSHPDLRDYVAPAKRVGQMSDLPPSLCGLVWWLFDGIDPDDASYFMERLADGQGLVKHDPIYELRRVIQQSRSVRGERSMKFLMAVTIKAWNSYRNGNEVKLLGWRAGGHRPESFPEPV